MPKFALRWAPIRDLTLRASYSRSFRTPTLFEFFEPHTENTILFPIIFDPAAPGGPAFVQPPGGTQVGVVDLQPDEPTATARALFSPRDKSDSPLCRFSVKFEGLVVTISPGGAFEMR